MRDLVHLTARRFEQDCGPDTPVDVAQRTLRICIERAGMTGLAGDIGLNRCVEPLLADLSEHDRAEVRDMKRRRGAPSGNAMTLPPNFYPAAIGVWRSLG